MSEMSYEDAVAALSAAAQVDPMVGGTPSAEQAEPTPAPVETPRGENPAPVQPAPEAPAPDPAPPVVEEPAAPAVEDTFTERFNPDTLPPELLPAWRQLQADYTRKTQALAEERRQLESLGDLEEVQAAVQLYEQISDPQNWVQLHQELTEALVDAGLTPAQAQAAATQEMNAQAAQAQAQFNDLAVDDPDLAPLAQALQQMRDELGMTQAQLAAIQAEQADLEAQAEAEREHQAFVAQQRQVLSEIAEANPHYDEDDLKAVIQLSSFLNGDLVAAQQEFEAHVTRRMQRYFDSKQAALSPALQPQPGAGVDSTTVEDTPESILDVEAGAVEYIRGLQAQGLFDD